jgi:3-oxoacyl-(acyl-carrier-protein) synthase
MRRVVVTGVGAITPLANGAQLTWGKLISSQSGISFNQVMHQYNQGSLMLLTI